MNGPDLMRWFFPTRTFRSINEGPDAGGETGTDDQLAAKGVENMGAWILGRNMFGPVRGPWPDDRWKGWWGDEPPYHMPTFVLTHHVREPLVMKGGTTFHFVTGGIEEPLTRAKQASGEKDIRIGGGASTVRQYLRAGRVDDLHLAVSPVILGEGEALFHGIDLRALGYRCTRQIAGERATHMFIERG